MPAGLSPQPGKGSPAVPGAAGPLPLCPSAARNPAAGTAAPGLGRGPGQARGRASSGAAPRAARVLPGRAQVLPPASSLPTRPAAAWGALPTPAPGPAQGWGQGRGLTALGTAIKPQVCCVLWASPCALCPHVHCIPVAVGLTWAPCTSPRCHCTPSLGAAQAVLGPRRVGWPGGAGVLAWGPGHVLAGGGQAGRTLPASPCPTIAGEGEVRLPQIPTAALMGANTP